MGLIFNPRWEWRDPANPTRDPIPPGSRLTFYLGKNNGEKLLPRSLVMKLFEATSGFAEREKKLYCHLDCFSEWLHSLYL